jgi:putative inorganic carbon (hco3(-)) transporter
LKPALIPLVALVVLTLAPLGYFFVASPLRTILPVYAAILPIGSALKLSIPLPSPFNTVSSVLGMVVVVCLLLHLVLYRRFTSPGLQPAVWLLFLSWQALTVFWAVDAGVATSGIVIAAPLVLMVVLIGFTSASDHDLAVLKLAIVLSGAIVGLFALFLIATGKPLPTHGVSQRFSIVANPQDTDPNILAASLQLPLALSLELILVGQRRWLSSWAWRAVGVVTVALCLTAILLTGSRGGTLAALVTFGLVLFYANRIPGVKRIARGIVAAGVAILSLLGLIAFLTLRFMPQSPLEGVLSADVVHRLTSESSSGRAQIWTTGLLACERDCAWGAGLENFPIVYNQQQAFSAVTKNVGANRPAHDVYLQLAVESGVVGLTLFLLAVLAEWLALAKPEMRMLGVALKPALAGLLVANMFLSAIWFKYFWLVFIVTGVTISSPSRHVAPGRVTSRGGDKLPPLVA